MGYDFVDSLPPPLGGRGLRPLMAPDGERQQLAALAATLPQVEISGRAFGDLVMLGLGGFTPLGGFMGRADWQSVCRSLTLADGTFWPLPIVLDVAEAAGELLGKRITLTHHGRQAALMEVAEVWRMDEEDLWFEAISVFRGRGPDSECFEATAPQRHPGVRQVLGRGRIYLAGPLKVLTTEGRPNSFMPGPLEFRKLAEEKGWKNIICLQLRNPPHRSHEYLARLGLEVGDCLLIHTPIGALKPGDLPLDIRRRCIQALIDNYLPADRTILAGYPLDMRYAGPREALLHAAFRQNYGVAVQIVGRDHAGVGDFYNPFESQEIFDKLPHSGQPGRDLLTRPLKVSWAFFCRRCDSMASLQTCPHSREDWVLQSGSALRKNFTEKTPPPPHFIREEILQILTDYYQSAPPTGPVSLFGAASGQALERLSAPLNPIKKS